ncbi:hypothetical protein R1sor_027160 [Riccia sorocarpa]|uniref:Uncharacterized protein n=1 Tax=Riccia sorocarpa TaxID=122646 RepID=A0ABD3GGB3_9MARC
MARDGPQAGAPLHFELYTEEDDDNYMRWKWISKKEARRVLRGIDPQLLLRSGLNDALRMDWSRPEEGTEFVKEFVLKWDDTTSRSTVDGEIVPLNVNVIREVFGLEEGRTVPRSARQHKDLSDWVLGRSKIQKTWFANDVFMPEWRPIIQLINVVLLGKQKPLEVTGAFLYILKNKVGHASLNEDLDWTSYFKEKIREEIRACRKQMMAAGKRKIRPTCIGIVVLHILQVRGIVDDGQLVRSDSDESVEPAGDRATNTTTSDDRSPQGGEDRAATSADSPERSPQGCQDRAITSAYSPVRSPQGGQDRATTSADSPLTSPQGVEDEGSPGNGRSGDTVEESGVSASSPNRALPCSPVRGSSGSPKSGDAYGTLPRTSTSPDLRRASISSPDSEVPVARPTTSPDHSTPTTDRGQRDDVGVLEISPATADADDLEVAESLRFLRGHSRAFSQREKWAEERTAFVNSMEALARRERSIAAELSTLRGEWGSEKKQLNTKIEELKFALDTAAKVRQTALSQEEKQSLLNEIEVLRSARDSAAQSRVNNGQPDETQKLLKEIEDLRSAAASATRQREEETNRWDRARRLLEEDKLLLIKESEDLRSAAEIREEEKAELERLKKLTEEDRQKLVKEIEDLFAASANVARAKDEERKQWDSTKAELMEQIRYQDPELSGSHLDQLKQDRRKLENEIRMLEEHVCGACSSDGTHDGHYVPHVWRTSTRRIELTLSLFSRKVGGRSHANAKLLAVQRYGTR